MNWSDIFKAMFFPVFLLLVGLSGLYVSIVEAQIDAPSPPTPYYDNPMPEVEPDDLSSCQYNATGCVEASEVPSEILTYCQFSAELFYVDQGDSLSCNPEYETGVCVEDCSCPNDFVRETFYHVCVPDLSCFDGIANLITGLCWPPECPYGDGLEEDCFPEQQCVDGENAILFYEPEAVESTQCVCDGGTVWSNNSGACVGCPTTFQGFELDENCELPKCIQDFRSSIAVREALGYPSDLGAGGYYEICQNNSFAQGTIQDFQFNLTSYTNLDEGFLVPTYDPDIFNHYICLDASDIAGLVQDVGGNDTILVEDMTSYLITLCGFDPTGSSNSSSTSSSSSSSSSNGGGGGSSSSSGGGGGTLPGDGSGSGSEGPASEQLQSGECDPTSANYFNCLNLEPGNLPAHTDDGPQTLEEVFQNFSDAISESPLNTALGNVGSVLQFNESICPPLSMDLTGTVIDAEIQTEFHCEIMSQIDTVLTLLMISVYGIMGFRIVASA